MRRLARCIVSLAEVAIGLFPDVGASYFMPSVFGQELALYLALTGRSIRGGANAVTTRVATHFVPSSRLPRLRHDLAALPARSCSCSDVAAVVAVHSDAVDCDDPANAIPEAEVVRQCFAGAGSVRDVLMRLQLMGTSTDIARDVLKNMQAASPTSLLVTFELVSRACRRCRCVVAVADAVASAVIVALAVSTTRCVLRRCSCGERASCASLCASAWTWSSWSRCSS
jgi:enoyl-CoA hydratase/carnithine racemase